MTYIKRELDAGQRRGAFTVLSASSVAHGAAIISCSQDRTRQRAKRGGQVEQERRYRVRVEKRGATASHDGTAWPKDGVERMKFGRRSKDKAEADRRGSREAVMFDQSLFTEYNGCTTPAFEYIGCHVL